jgi:putative ABC transport system permease protein
VPGVEQVALVSVPPFFGITEFERVRRADAPVGANPLNVIADQVSADYFSLLRIPMLRGAPFDYGDEWPDSSRTVGKVIVSARLAQNLFGQADPLGQMVVLRTGRKDLHAQVVGIVGDVHWTDRRGEAEPTMYYPVGQGLALYGPMIAVRSRGPQVALDRQVQEIGRSLDPAMPVRSNGPLRDMVAQSIASQQLLFRLLGLLSALTLLLAAVGVYSLVAYSVTTRTREFGLRVALGAEAGDILRAAARPAFVIVGIGIIVGAAGAMYLTRFIKALLYGVSPLDPVAFVAAAGLLCVAVLLASWIPARKASHVDPMTALRYE